MIVVDASVLVEALDAPLVTADAALATCPGLRTSVEVLPL